MTDALIHLLLVPPANLLLLMALALLFQRRWPRASRWVGGSSFALLLVLSTGIGSRLVAGPLENRAVPLADPRTTGAQAIVVLGAGSVYDAPEYGGVDVPDDVALARLRYGAHLQHATGLPLLVTGGNGSPDGKRPPKAWGMARALREDFRTPVRWVEDRASNTQQNARFSAALLRPAGIRRVILVTHALHMERALLAFRAAGLDPVPAPTRFSSKGPLGALSFFPSAASLYRSYYAFHEWIGLAWYRIQME
jgi:uncharacterized SAM-binding protein YcdF (DUF218 family)